MKITKQDIKFFLTGFFCILIIEIINWKNFVKVYEIGYNNAAHKN